LYIRPIQGLQNLGITKTPKYNYAKHHQIFFNKKQKLETFEKCLILFKAKEGENFNHRNTLSILRIKI